MARRAATLSRLNVGSVGGREVSEARSIDLAQLREGDAVDTNEEENLGHIIAFWPDMITPTHLVVEGGLLLHHDWYIPVTAIAAHLAPGEGGAGRVLLNVSRAHVNASGWNAPPPGAPPAHELIGE
jgi:hypothetical protein